MWAPNEPIHVSHGLAARNGRMVIDDAESGCRPILGTGTVGPETLSAWPHVETSLLASSLWSRLALAHGLPLWLPHADGPWLDRHLGHGGRRHESQGREPLSGRAPMRSGFAL